MSGIAIHGFGRIGRSALKAALRRDLFVPVCISDIKDLPTLAALFEADSNYGRWSEAVTPQDGRLEIGPRSMQYIESTRALPDWGALGVELVIDCTGRATTRSGAQAHLDRGAKRVLISAASKTLQDADAVLLPGINMDQFDPRRHRIVSMASCTTNALAPVIKVLLDNFGIKCGRFSTVHAYTNTQALTDQPMRERRDSWSAAENIIPSSSGATRALRFVWPGLTITGTSYRVPVRTVSIAEVNVVTERTASAEEVKELFRTAAKSGPMRGIVDVLEEEWASARILGDAHSSIIDLPLLQTQGDTMVSVAAWYDNEMGYATRLAEAAAHLITQS
ncbi:MAG: glyceraldehyde 3-phosphate dehydrogenase NAD-binding domain-containing protein [Kiritimatiellae bacterium]|nr:glyceraldehyde 3-phosphate dehydrogenase NAD-binding domain-containing protein [Kiritimatiellia bacterium]